MRFIFKMKLNDKTVGSGSATGSLCYRFQKEFIEYIGPNSKSVFGSFIHLETIMALKVGESLNWKTEACNGSPYYFEVEKVAE